MTACNVAITLRDLTTVLATSRLKEILLTGENVKVIEIYSSTIADVSPINASYYLCHIKVVQSTLREQVISREGDSVVFMPCHDVTVFQRPYLSGIRINVPVGYVCWFSILILEVFMYLLVLYSALRVFFQVLRFPPLTKSTFCL